MAHEAVCDKGSASSNLLPSFLPESKLMLCAQIIHEKRKSSLKWMAHEEGVAVRWAREMRLECQVERELGDGINQRSNQ